MKIDEIKIEDRKEWKNSFDEVKEAVKGSKIEEDKRGRIKK